MKRIAAILLYSLAHIHAAACGAQTSPVDPRTKRIDEIVQYYTNQSSFMGTVLVAEGDKVLLNKGYGFADLEWDIRQQSTAAAILLLQEDGKLHLTDLIAT